MAWNNVLCMYYSPTGNTIRAMEEIARALDAELVELEDGTRTRDIPAVLKSLGIEAEWYFK